jgi:hypothetical protein
MTDRYVDVNSQSNLHHNLNEVTQHFEVYGKGKKSKPRQRNKKYKTIFSEIKTLKKEN